MVSIVVREVAARDFESDSVTFQKHADCCTQVNMKEGKVAWCQEFFLVQTVPMSRPDHTITYLKGLAIRIFINQSGKKTVSGAEDLAYRDTRGTPAISTSISNGEDR
jgi:hypothetical protein